MGDTVFPLALKLVGRAALVVGGNEEALDKAHKLTAAGARVRVFASAVEPALAAAARVGSLSWFAREPSAADLTGAVLLVYADRDPDRALTLRTWARKAGALFGAVDQPEVSDFFLTSVVRRGPLVISIGTGGRAPSLARAVRRGLEAGLGLELSAFAEDIAALRASLRELPMSERRARLAAALAGFALSATVRYPEHTGTKASGASRREP